LEARVRKYENMNFVKVSKLYRHVSLERNGQKITINCLENILDQSAITASIT